jgi:hypothetical protein
MIQPFFEQHADACVLLPTLAISTATCDCGQGDKAWLFTLDFLVWSIGIVLAPH